MGGGLPAAAFGGRADVMARLAPAGPVYQAGTLSGNPVATAAGLATLRACDRRRLRATSTRPPAELGGLAVRRAARRPACRTGCSTRAACSRCSSAPDAVADYAACAAAGDVPLRRVLPRDARRAASTCRRPRSSRGSSPPPTTTRRSRGSPMRCPHAARAAASATPRGRRMSETTVVHLLRHGEVHNPTGVLYGRLPGFRLSDLGHAMADRIAERVAGDDITHLVSSPLERAQETAAPSAPRRSACRCASTTASSRPGNVFEGKTFGVGDGALHRPGALDAPAQPVAPVLGRALHRDRRADAGRDGRRPRCRARPRGPARQPPAADLDGPVVRDRTPALARPAQAAVLARVAHLVHLRRRRARVGGLRGAGPRPAAGAGATKKFVAGA